MSSLVSVIIATYNSSSFVIETLESVFQQTWDRIELILTDDCSKDDTVDLCASWLSEHKKKFVRAEIIASPTNTGVSSNVNRGIYAAKGDWLKALGADDKLMPNCIEENMKWFASNPGARVLFSQVNIYKNTFEASNFHKTVPYVPLDPDSIVAKGRSVESQYKMLLISDRIHFTPSVFIFRETIISIGGLDERFRLLDDYPLWLNLTRNGFNLHFMDKVTVNYRKHNKAINNTDIETIVNPNYFLQEKFRRIYTYPYLPKVIRLDQRFRWYASQVFRFKWLNRNSRLNKLLLAFLTVYLNPFKYCIWMKLKLNKNLRSNEYYI